MAKKSSVEKNKRRERLVKAREVVFAVGDETWGHGGITHHSRESYATAARRR